MLSQESRMKCLYLKTNYFTMKQFYLSAVILLAFIGQSRGQFAESFEGPVFPPQGWGIYNNGVGTAESWEALQTVAMPQSNCDGLISARIDRENIGAGNTSEDWLVTPPITIAPEGILSFCTRSTVAGNQGTQYDIRVSTTSQFDQASFTTIASWTESELSTTFNIFDQKTISLSEYSFQTIYVAFVRRYTQPDAALSGDRWIIDSINIAGPAQQINNINGTVSFGQDCDLAVPVNLFPVSISATDGMAYSYSADGYYSLNSVSTDFVVSAVSENPYFTINPPSYTINFNGLGNSQSANFCLLPNGIHSDLEIVMVPTNSVVDANIAYHIIVKNKGNQTQSGTVNFQFNDDALDYISAVPDVQSQILNNLVLPFTDLEPLHQKSFVVMMHLNGPDSTPPVLNDSVLNYVLTVFPTSGDETPADNVFNIDQAAIVPPVIIGFPYDPNDKIIVEGATISPEEALDYLHYIISLQNVWPGPATFVRITDQIAENLDISTLQILGGSHGFRTEVSGNFTEFIFDDILLTAEMTDEPNSHGYVIFKIKPKNTVGLGSVISNNANIYFDSNAPITTNWATTTVILLGATEFRDDSFTIYPNPVRDEIHVKVETNISLQRVTIYNMLGQLVKNIAVSDASNIDVSNLNNGTYIVEIISNRGKACKKLIKM
jgi:hypothetical protein